MLGAILVGTGTGWTAAGLTWALGAPLWLALLALPLTGSLGTLAVAAWALRGAPAPDPYPFAPARART